MKEISTDQTAPTIFRLTRDKADFSRKVSCRSGVNTSLCWQCKCCSNGCPFSDAMDYYPNQVMRMVQIGMKEEVLSASAIWICVGCNTCSVECPQSIDMASVMDALRQIAIEEGVTIGETDILNFHREVLDSIRRYGRTHKLEIMMRYKIKKRDWFSDMNLGVRMMSKRKLDLRPSKVHQLSRIKNIFQKAAEEKVYEQPNC